MHGGSNWLRCDLSVNVGQLKGHINIALTTHDLVSFRDEIRSILSSTETVARLQTYEDGIDLEITMHPTGTATISGTCRSSGAVDVLLSFTMHSDQSYLRHTLSGLVSVTGTYPVRSGM